jgi:hypothetical protein
MSPGACPRPERTPPGYIRTGEDTHDPGLSRGIRRILRHLPVSVDLSAIHHQSQRRNQKQTHGDYDQ